METNHMNISDGVGQVYCYKYDEITPIDPKYFETRCKECPYFLGFAGNEGVECLFDDRSNIGTVEFYDPADSEKWAKYTDVRLGIRTRKEVDDSLSGISRLESDEELGITKKRVKK